MLIEIAMQKIPAQKVRLILNNQECSLCLYEKGETNPRLYLDLYKDDKAICLGAICLKNVPIIQRTQSDFVGNLVFISKNELLELNHQNLSEKFLFSNDLSISSSFSNDSFVLLYFTDDEDEEFLQQNNL